MPRKARVEHNPVPLFEINERHPKDTFQGIPVEPHELYVHTPTHCPMSMRLVSRIEDTSPAPRNIIRDQAGFTLEQRWFTFGVKVYTKYDRKTRRLVLFADSGDGPEKLKEWQQ